jgi:hypothetical protein
MPEIEPFVLGIGHFLSDRLLAVPDFQRNYSWEVDDQVSEFYRDLNEAMASDASEYFLGSVVTSRSVGAAQVRLHVIDGQQRLATTSLLYAALRDIFSERSDERATEIERDLLGKRDIVTRRVEQRMSLNADDNEFFRRITLERPRDRRLMPGLESHVRLQAAFEDFRKKFLKLIEGLGPDDWQLPLLKWYSFVLERATILEVRLTNEHRAFVIFETLNTRGLDLSTTDLLRNHLFGVCGARLEEAKVRWSRAFAPFSIKDSNLDADAFLRHFWASRRGVVRVKALYSEIKPGITTADEALDLMDELVICSPLWVGMFDRDSEVWARYRAPALAALEALSNLDVQQCRPLLLAALRKLAQREVEQLLELILGWSIRWFVVGGGSAGTVERLYAVTATNVMSGQLTTAAGIAQQFANDVPADTAFEEAFAIATVRRGWLARYYLYALEQAAIGKAEPELVPNQDVEQVNLEHVLPRNPSGDWDRTFNSDQIQSMRLMLGNQVLLRKSQNARLGNKSFAEKRKAYAASDLVLTKEVSKLNEWAPAAIRARQERLARLAPKIWRRT